MTEVGVRRVGEHALLLEVADNAAAVRAARAVRESLRGVVDVVPGHATLLVGWREKPAREELLACTAAALRDESPAAPTASVEIAVSYEGPDLADVARLAGVSVEEAVERHLRADYRVGFVGFAPGFAYLLGLDERLHVPRLEEPRQRVPAGSVAVAGPYTGVYPRESPGGWRLVGRTDATIFDPSRSPPALLAPGDRVRFSSG